VNILIFFAEKEKGSIERNAKKLTINDTNASAKAKRNVETNVKKRSLFGIRQDYKEFKE